MNGFKPSKTQPALIGGIALGVASAIPPLSCLNACCCALVIGGGVLAAFLWLKDQPAMAEAPYGDGAVLGLMTGGIGAVVATVISIPVQLITTRMGWQPDMSQMEEAFEEMPPEVAQIIQPFLEQTMSGGVTIAAILMGFLFNLVVYSIFALLGGIIGVAIFHKKGATAAPAGGGYAPPPPPTA